MSTFSGTYIQVPEIQQVQYLQVLNNALWSDFVAFSFVMSHMYGLSNTVTLNLV
jgi:hypothetical protein